MARDSNFMQIFEAYADAFPGHMPDSRGMAGEDFDNLQTLMQRALDRGSPITPDDLSSPVCEPNPETGLML